MDTNLRGMNLPSPRFRLAPLSKELSHVRGFNSLQTFFPTLTRLYKLNRHQSEGIWLDSKWRIAGLDISGTSGPCRLTLVPNTDISGNSLPSESREHSAYLKVTHLLDPIRWMKGLYSLPKQSCLPGHTKTWTTAWTKLQDSWNQAYIETVAAYAMGRLRDEGVSPHFNEFYGAFCARADIYRYNLSEEFSSYRNERWFWNGQNKGLYKLFVMGKDGPDQEIPADVLEELLREPTEMNSDSDSASDSDSDSDSASDSDSESEDDDDEIEVDTSDEDIIVVDSIDNIETTSLHSDKMSNISFAEESSDESEESDMPDDSYKIYAELNNFPVMLIAIEKNSGTMDELLDTMEDVGAIRGTPEWELHWSAWLFQVIAALSVAQTFFGFTHNDLHSNNIVWTPTTEEYMYYTLRSGAAFKVPTFGKLFRIIDFGRAIFTINNTQFISDDFRPGNDADGQYSFKPLTLKPIIEVSPNPSFDLARLAVSLFEALFPDKPADKEGGITLSSEEGIIVNETVSPLFNCMWTWMLDDDGCNILIESDGNERFPDFDLYKHIAAKIHNAIPSQQFKQAAFDRFQVNPSEIGKDVKQWPLFA